MFRDPIGEAFSVREFVRQAGGGCLFITSRQDQFEALRPWISLWFDLAATEVLARRPVNPPRVWFVLDEVASLRVNALQGLLERGFRLGRAGLALTFRLVFCRFGRFLRFWAGFGLLLALLRLDLVAQLSAELARRLDTFTSLTKVRIYVLSPQIRVMIGSGIATDWC